MKDRLRVVVFFLVFGIGVGTLALLSGISTRFQPPRREGPVALVRVGDRQALWMLLRREERRKPSTRGRAETRHHHELHAHDPRTGGRLWKRTLRVVHDRDGGLGSQARILGQDGDALWCFVHDGPVALSASDGAPRLDRAAIARANPDLADLLPTEASHYVFLDRLLVLTADARWFALRPGDGRARAVAAPDPDALRAARFRATTWNGGFRTGDFTVRQGTVAGRWVGLHGPREARDVVDDPYGDRLNDPQGGLDEGSGVRRSLFTARLGRTRAFKEGRHARLTGLDRVPDAETYLQGGFLSQPGSRVPRRMDGALVLHRTRIDARGRLAVTRLDGALRPLWSVALPVAELTNRWDLGAHLALFGDAPRAGEGTTASAEMLVVLNLEDGTVRAWDVASEAAVGAP